MSIQRTLQKYMDDWKTISSLDFVLSLMKTKFCNYLLPFTSFQKKLSEFRESNALIMANTSLLSL